MPSPPEKILIIRLSSIGDIVLTSPVVRALRNHLPDAQIHYLTKQSFASLVELNPNIDKVHTYDKSLPDTINELKGENFDLILDLHKNLRSWRISLALGVKRHSFPKVNFKKYILTNFKIDILPSAHIVERYAEVLKPLGAKLDGEGLDFFLTNEAEEKVVNALGEFGHQNPVAIVLGGNWNTKKWPKEYYVKLLAQLKEPVVLLGGKDEEEAASFIQGKITVPSLNAVGKFNLIEAAAFVKHAKYVISHDTGLMHIAAAFQKKVFSLWGNTVIHFGMYPYKTGGRVIQTANLDCRPCSKIGFNKCPKGHFKCMLELTPELVESEILKGLKEE